MNGTDKSQAEAFGSLVPSAEPLWYSRGSSPYYNESHRILRARVRQYVDNELRPYAEDWEAIGKVPQQTFQRHAEMGFFITTPTEERYMGGMHLPAGISPRLWDGFHSLIVADELARTGYFGVIMGLSGGNSIASPPIKNFGTEEQKLHFLPRVARGEIRLCLGITEPDAGSDVSRIKTTAERKDNYYLVTGTKKWITNGLWSHYCVTAVRTGGPGHAGISLLIVPLGISGVTRRRMENSGVKASGSTMIEFDAVRVPLGNLIGAEDKGFSMIMSNFNPERLGMACSALRLSRICAEDSYKHSLSRETFGQPLISYGVIRTKFTNFGIAIEPAFALLEQLVWIVEQSRRSSAGSALNVGGMTATLKITSTRCLEYCVREAQQILGGLGYAKGGKGGRIEQISRDVRMFVVGGGSEEIMSELALKQEINDLKKLSLKIRPSNL